MIDESCVGAIVVTGSHGGVTRGRAVAVPVEAAFFNDAGVGKGRAGISRLPVMDRMGIPGAAVDRRSAMIGDGWQTYDLGVISHLNDTARDRGLSARMTARDAVQILMKPDHDHT
jgi:hypothetical protein